MHGDARRLVDHQHRFVLEEHFELGGRHRRLFRRCFFGDADGRHAHNIAQFEAVLRIDPPLIHTHFAAAQNAINVAFRHAFAHAQEEIVDPLTGGAIVDLDEGNLVTCDLILGYFA
ncbi:hypothetical protein F4827_000130 [Paraburkholderia bannensis]|uniref:Uncharacterized protein n=1 Tax=Paraburkholderia bannensis TaxID=765414 RepID=A0A7W9TTD7_9BURK|nr:hypothetical protein [Paraburkholderia sp. WP4_3_2]MBB6100326.1 hypothetical protein [Paraburkholderia bannensis]